MKHKAAPPNIIVLCTDDHAQWALGCYGDPDIHSPAMDRLAQGGVRMANAFTQTPVCSPARASFFTGLLASQHGIHDYLGRAQDDMDWIGGETTLPELLQAAGYRTGLVGKWHCGGGRGQKQKGFDHWVNRKGGLSRPEQSRFLMDEAIAFTRDPDAMAAPYFLFISDVSTHSDWRGHSPEWVDRFRDCGFPNVPVDEACIHGNTSGEKTPYYESTRTETLAQYYAAVSEVDVELGRLMDDLEVQGTLDSTVIVYTSDHGICLGHHGVWGKGNGTRPLNMFEESIRIPMILSWPGTIQPGTVPAEMVDHCDLFSTLLELAKVPQPDRTAQGLPYPGRSFARLLHGDDIPNWRQVQFGDYGYLRMARTERYKLVRRYLGRPSELFDLQEDPRERDNRYDDPACQQIIDALTHEIDAYFGPLEHPEKSGLRVLDLPSYNGKEAWRAEPP